MNDDSLLNNKRATFFSGTIRAVYFESVQFLTLSNMKTTAVFLLACFLLAESDVKAQIKYDSIRSKHLRDSAWDDLHSYDYYGWAFEWDSMYLVRWTSWSCEAINEREDTRRAKEEARLRKRTEEDDAAFPEYTKAKNRKSKKELTERH